MPNKISSPFMATEQCTNEWPASRLRLQPQLIFENSTNSMATNHAESQAATGNGLHSSPSGH